MARNRNKRRIIDLVARTLEKRQWTVGLRSWELNDVDISECHFNNRRYKLTLRPSKTGLNRHRKPRTDVC